MNKIIGEIMFLSGYVLLCVSLAAIAFRMHFWIGTVVVAIELIITSAILSKDKKQDIQH